MPAAPTASADTIVPPLHLAGGEIRFYQQEGYLLLPGLISTGNAARLRDEVMHIMDLIGLEVSKLRQTTEYLPGTALDALVNSRDLRSIAGQLMQGPATLYMPFTAVKSGAGGTFHFHQDNNYTRFDGPGINLWFALTDMSPENGCLQVVPRSHLHGTVESINAGDGDGHRKVALEPHDFLPVRMRPGDCIAFSRLTIHGSGPNRTAAPRVGYAIQYHRDDVNALIDGEWKRLKDHPRWNVKPVDKISVPKGKTDGH